MLRALAVPADAADRAPTLVLDGPAALRTSTPLRRLGLQAGVISLGLHVRLDRLGDTVGAGEDLVVAEAGWGVAGNAEELLDHLARLDAAPPGERHHPPDRLALGGGASAGLPHGGEKFEKAALVLVDGNVDGAAAGLHLVGPPL